MKIGNIKRLPSSVVDGFREVSTSTIGTVTDKMGIDGIVTGLRCLVPGVRMVGSAFTVKACVGTLGTYRRADFPAGEVIDSTEAGDVLVVDMGGQEVSTMGGLGGLAMKLKRVRGMVVDGGVRDAEQIISLGFPTYVVYVCARSAITRVKWLAANTPVKIRGVRVNPGDIIVADDTSVAVIPLAKAADILQEIEKIEKLEKQFEEELKKGLSFRETSRKLGTI